MNFNSRAEKINYLKAIKAGDKTVIKQIQIDNFFKTLSEDEVTFIIEHSECFPNRAMSNQEIRDILKNGMSK